jgi:hypothetical protein
VFAVAVVLGAVAVWLIVTSTTQKRIELGILAGLWGLLLGTFSVLGSRRVVQPVAVEASPGAEVELRSATQLERNADAQARREYEAHLEQMLREEVRQTMGSELAEMRAEIAQLRSELLEKVGGQLRLERIETTRLIGSDLEALQDEVRKLKFSKSPDELSAEFAVMPGVASLQRIVEHTSVTPAPEPVEPARPVEVLETVAATHVVEPVGMAAPVEAAPVTPAEVAPVDVAAEQTAPIWPRRVAAETLADEPVAEPQPETVAEPEPELEPEPIAERQPVLPVAVTEPAPLPIELPEPIEAGPAPVPLVPEPVGASSSRFDALASLPRLRPFTEFELDPIPPTAPPAPNVPSYHGRRRSRDDESTEPAGGRHAAPSGGHRRTADADADADTGDHAGNGHDDLLARLLARESVR